MENNLDFDLGKIFALIQERSDLFSTFESLLSKNEKINPHDFGINMSFLNVNCPDQQYLAFVQLLRFFPDATRIRRHLKRIEVKPTHWFKKGVTYANVGTFEGGPISSDPELRASILSLLCGQASFMPQEPLNVYDGLMIMYDFPSCIDFDVVGIYQAYTFLHEVAHIYAKSAYHWKHYVNTIKKDADYQSCGYLLQLPDGKIIDAEAYIEGFTPLIDAYGPFGSYSAGYKEGYKKLHESFADATAAYFMGFMMYPEKDFAPVHEEVKKYLYDFYHAKAIIDL